MEQFIRNNQEQFDKKMPDPAVLDRVMAKMNIKSEVKPAGIIIPFKVLKWSAAAILLIVFGVTFWIVQKPQPEVKTAKIKVPAVKTVKNITDSVAPVATVIEITKKEHRKSFDEIDQDLNLRKHNLMAKLKATTMRSEKAVIFAGLNNMESPATRINFASEAYKLKNSGNDIVDALVSTLNSDPNANVRLAALDALARFYQESYVRKKLVASLKKQQDPIVQITLINLLTRMKESGILSELDKIVNDENTQKPVKDCAYSGIIQLRS